MSHYEFYRIFSFDWFCGRCPLWLDAEDWFGEGVQFVDDDQTKQQLLAGQTDLSDGEESDDEKRDRMIEDGAEEEEEQLLLAEDQRSVDVDGSDGDSLVTQGRTPLAKVDIAEMSVAEMMSDKPRTTASKLRQQKASGIAVDDERDKFREIVTPNLYKYRRILTPQQVKELYSDDDGKRKRSGGGGGDVDDVLVEFTGSSHLFFEFSRMWFFVVGVVHEV